MKLDVNMDTMVKENSKLAEYNEVPVIEHFYSHLNMEDITYADYTVTKRFCKDFKINNLGEYHDFYVQNDTLLLVDVFENFWDKCLEIHVLNLVRFLISLKLAWQAVLKNTNVKLFLLTDINMLLMVEKGIKGGKCHTIYWYSKANNKYMKDDHKNKKLSYLNYWDVNNLYEWEISKSYL